MRTELVHVVMGGGFVFAAYWNPELAYRHARCLTGCTVAAVDLATVPEILRVIIRSEIRLELPSEIVDDINAEWDSDDDDVTPQVHEIDLGDLDDR